MLPGRTVGFEHASLQTYSELLLSLRHQKNHMKSSILNQTKCYNFHLLFSVLLIYTDVQVKDTRKSVKSNKRRTAHTVAEQKRRDAIKVNDI